MLKQQQKLKYNIGINKMRECSLITRSFTPIRCRLENQLYPTAAKFICANSTIADPVLCHMTPFTTILW